MSIDDVQDLSRLDADGIWRSRTLSGDWGTPFETMMLFVHRADFEARYVEVAQ